MSKSTVLLLAALCLAPFAQAQNTLAGNLTVQQAVKLTGAASPAQLTSNANDYAPAGFSTAAVLRLQADVPRTITGLAGGVAGRMMWLTNVGSQTITLATESASSTAANRFAFGASGFDLPAGGSLSIWYDTTSSRWRSATNLAAGGGGTAIDQTARDAAAAAQATADSKQAALANAGTLAKVTEAAGLPLWDGAPWPGGGSGGTGTVTSVSVVSANGVSGSVANASTTPAITLALGAITPTSVAASGAVTGSNLSGTNTGDQTSVSGNAGTATKLATARAINGVAFDGTAAITVPSSAGTLTGTTLASGVTASSLTSAAGGSFGTAAFTAAIAYDPAGAAAAITLAGLGGVPTTRTINGHALSGNVTVTPSDLSLAIGTNTQAWSGKLDSVTALAAGTGWLHNDGTGALAWSTPSKSDVGLGAVENTALSAWSGSANLATVGTITSGTWHGTAIADAYVSGAAGWNAKVSFPGFGTTGATAAVGNDARLSDARTPTAHTQAWSTITATPTTISGYGIADAQPLDSDLTAIAALATDTFGRDLLTKTTATNVRTYIGAGTSSFDGAYASLSGKPTTLSGYGITDAQGLDSDLTALAGNATNGLWARTSAGTGSARTITGTANQVTVTNGDGVSGNPTLALPQGIATASTPQFARLGIGQAASGTIPLSIAGDFSLSGNILVNSASSVARLHVNHGSDIGYSLLLIGATKAIRVSHNSNGSLIEGVDSTGTTSFEDLYFNGKTVGFSTGSTTRMTISSAGAIRLNSYGAGTLVTDSSGNVTASSDRRLKNVSGKFTRGLGAIMEIQPKVFTWKPESGMNPDDINVGFIAQDVQPAIPEAVGSMKTVDTEEDDGTGKKVKKSKREASEYLTLSDRPIIAALVNAVKELKAENDALLARVIALEKGKATK